MKNIWNLVDNSLGQSESAVAGVDSTFIKWERDLKNKKDKIFYCNNLIYKIREFKTKPQHSFALLFESKAIIPETYKYAYRIINKYNLFFTHDSDLLKFSNARWIPGGGVWIGGNYGLGQIKIFEKNSLVSMVSSDKRMCPLHEFRLQVLQAVSSCSNVNILGSAVTGWVPIHKSLDDYMFSIIIENFIDDLYFTEKINNCFATGTIPIYYGARHIDKIYNPEGIITFSTISELVGIINNLKEDDYYKRMNAVKDNHEKCKQFISIEDYIYLNYFESEKDAENQHKINIKNKFSDNIRKHITFMINTFHKLI